MSAAGNGAPAASASKRASRIACALVASLLAPRRADAIAGVISLSGPALRLLDLMRGQIVTMSPGGDLSAVDACIAAIRAGEPLPEWAHTNPQTQMLASMPPESHIYLRSVDAVDPTAAIALSRRQPVYSRISRPTAVIVLLATRPCRCSAVSGASGL